MDKMQAKKDFLKSRTDFISWIKTYRKQLILIGVSIPTLIAIVLGVKSKDALMSVWQNLKEEIRKSNLYSSKWFEKASKIELDLEREKVRLEYCSSGNDFSRACYLENLLRRFDNELSKRAWGNETPHAPSIHREHGWYLPNDD